MAQSPKKCSVMTVVTTLKKMCFVQICSLTFLVFQHLIVQTILRLERGKWRAQGESEMEGRGAAAAAIWNCWAVIYLRDDRKDTSRSPRLIASGYEESGTSVIWCLSDRARWLYTTQAQLFEEERWILNQRKFLTFFPCTLWQSISL